MDIRSSLTGTHARFPATHFAEFLTDTSKPAFNYVNDIERMLRLDETRLIVSLDDLRDYKPEFRTLADGFVSQPSYLSPVTEPHRVAF